MDLHHTRQLLHQDLDRSQPREALVLVLEAALELVSLPDNNFDWSSWTGQEQASAELRGLIATLQAGRLPERLSVAVLFAVTGPLQEVSLSSGWAQTFLKVADRFDEVQALLWQLPAGQICSTSTPSCR
ncbi:hypothetical protein AO265_06945 [Pseudomonas sp. ABAC61]|nr:hypothetical protein AO265_06945 [Pseudomonas sp. ABAC61]